MPDVILRPSQGTGDAQAYRKTPSQIFVRLRPADGSRGVHDVQLYPATKLDSPTQAGGSPPAVTGTGAVSFGVTQQSGTGKESFLASGGVSFGVTQPTGSGKETFASSGGISFAVTQSAGSGKETFKASGGTTFPVTLPSGSGSEGFPATGAVSFSVSTPEGSGKLTFTGSGGSSFTVTAPNGSGTVVDPGGPVSGTGAISFGVTAPLGTGTASVSVPGPPPAQPIQRAGSLGRTLVRSRNRPWINPSTGSGGVTFGHTKPQGEGQYKPLAIGGTGSLSLESFISGSAGQEFIGSGSVEFEASISGVGRYRPESDDAEVLTLLALIS